MGKSDIEFKWSDLTLSHIRSHTFLEFLTAILWLHRSPSYNHKAHEVIYCGRTRDATQAAIKV